MKDKLRLEYNPDYVTIDECCALNITLADYDQIRDAKINEIFLSHIDHADHDLVRASIGYLNDRKGDPIPLKKDPSGILDAITWPDDNYYPSLIRLVIEDSTQVRKLDTKYISLNFTVRGVDAEYDYRYFTVFKLSDIDHDCRSWVQYIVGPETKVGQAAGILFIGKDSEGNRQLFAGAHKNHLVEVDRIHLDTESYDD